MRSALLTLCVILLAGCAEKQLAGPTPAVSAVTKRDTADENPRTMFVGTATPVTVTGDRFVPMAGDTLLSRWFIELPELYLVNATSATKLTNLKWLNRQTMHAQIPAGIAVAKTPGWEDFQVVAIDPAGKRSAPGGTFRVSNLKPPIVKGAQISGGKAVARFCDTATTSRTPFDLTILGSDMVAGVQVVFALALTTASSTGVTATVMAVAPTGVTVRIPAGLTAGVYDVRVTNVDGQRNTLKNVFTVEFYTCPAGPQITSVYPRFIYQREDTMLQVSGNGFVATPQIWLANGAYAAAVSYEAFLTDTTLQGLLARSTSRALGWYSVTVTNPGGNDAGTLENAVLIIDTPIPRVASVTPDTFAASGTAQVTIRGENFPAGVTVAVFYENAGVPGVVVAANNATYSTVVTATINVAAIPVDNTIRYTLLLMRVFMDTPYGKVYGEYKYLVATSTSGNTGLPVESPNRLKTARAEFGLVGGRDGIGSRFIYAVGGRTSFVNPDTGTGLSTVEVSPVDVFGNFSAFYSNPTTIGVPRFGLGVIEYEGWLYAVGGRTAAGVTSEVKKAKILNPREAPEIVNISGAGGTLTSANWLYKVSAVLPDLGETLPSIEVGHDLSAAGGVTIVWKAVAGATSYRIYRIPDAASISGSEVLLQEGLVCCSFTDNGSVGIKVDTPLRPGALSNWLAAGTGLTTARAYHAVAIARDANGTPYVYAMGGENTGGTLLGNYEVSSITPGSDLSFSQNAFADLARKRGAVAVATKTSLAAAKRPGGADWITLYSGCVGTAAADANSPIGGVQVGGVLTIETTENSVRSIGGGGVIFASEQVIQFGGTNGPSACNPTTYVNGLTNRIDGGGVDAAYSWAIPNGNGGYALVKPRSDFGFTRFNAQTIIVGGVRDEAAGPVVSDVIEFIYY